MGLLAILLIFGACLGLMHGALNIVEYLGRTRGPASRKEALIGLGFLGALLVIIAVGA